MMESINWERSTDAELTWFRDEYLCPRAVGTLTQSFYPYAISGWPKNQREFWERQGHFRGLFVNGYFYYHVELGGPPSEAARERAQHSIHLWESEWLPEVQANLQRFREMALPDLHPDELARALLEALQITLRHFEIEGQIDGPSLMAIRRFTTWYHEHFPQAAESEPYQLLQGQEYSNVDHAQAVWELAAHATAEVLDALRDQHLAPLPAHFQERLNSYLQKFGDRPHAMYDIGSPNWSEEPAPVLQMSLRCAEEGAPNPEETRQTQARERDRLITELESRIAPTERETFRALVLDASAAIRAKEDHKFLIEQLTPGVVRRICIPIVKRMAVDGVIDEPGDVGHLTLGELINYGFGLSQPNLRPLIVARRAEFEANQRHVPAPFVGAAPEDEEEQSPGEAEAREFSGLGASAGVTRGRARVLHGPLENAALERGEVLVCPWTDPDWTPLLSLAAAIVTDEGGILSHAAITAREFGVPAVVGTGSASQRIKTGQLLEVDGLRGIVRVLAGP
jgi:phosphohistidine swiveling domain-containing protein